MDSIKLKVTSAVVRQASMASSQEQIAIVETPKLFESLFLSANKDSQIKVTVASELTLYVGDTHAIWGAHNKNLTDFKNLYTLLSKYPDKVFTFPLEII